MNKTALYQSANAKISAPLRADPHNHTMGNQNFLKYIGRHEARPDEIKTKKFTDEQKAAIITAFREDVSVRVIGALREDLEELTSILAYEPLGHVLHHNRPGKTFNNRRSSMVFVRPLNQNNPATELWVLTFPTAQYIDQIAQLIQAIIDDLATVNHKSYRGRVSVWHFPELERQISHWTAFDNTVKSYIRHGDVVAIGNIEFFSPGLTDAGFRSASPSWIDFGINEMFGVKLFVEEASSARIVLIGIRECFWGEASAHYIRSLIAAGARHILYGSKAASLVKEAAVHEVIAPKTFLTISSEWNSKNNPQLEHSVTFSGAHQSELSSLLNMFAIHQGGLSVTVPTVIGEDHDQRKAYEFQNPTCMDCENGHIAKVVQECNDLFSRFSPALQNSIKFVPVHFITDYIYRSDEAANPERSHLAVSAADPDYERRRDQAFRQIGHFFGVYALKYGQREYVHGHLRMEPSVRGLSRVPLEAIIIEVRPFLDFGFGREAIAVLLSLYRQTNVPATILLALAMVGQKYGYTDVFFQAARALNFGNGSSGLSATDNIRLKLFMIKHFTQVGDFVTALDEAQRLDSEQTRQSLKDMDQYCALQRRLAICFASIGDKAKCADAIAASEKDALNQDDRQPYQRAINTLWSYIASLHLGDRADSIDLTAVARELSEVRAVLGTLESNVWWQTNFEKGALAALFAEAAFFLVHGDRRQQSAGVDRLFLAGLLNVRIGGHEHSEAYGEIVAGVSNPDVREALILAMRTDVTAQIQFQNLVGAKNPSSIGLVHKCLALLHSSPATREAEMQKVLQPGS